MRKRALWGVASMLVGLLPHPVLFCVLQLIAKKRAPAIPDNLDVRLRPLLASCLAICECPPALRAPPRTAASHPIRSAGCWAPCCRWAEPGHASSAAHAPMRVQTLTSGPARLSW